MPALTPDIVPGGPTGEAAMKGGRRTRGATSKQLKKMLKAAGLKTSGRKAALTRRAKKAHLKLVKKGGADPESISGDVKMDGEKVTAAEMGGRRRSRKSRGFKLY